MNVKDLEKILLKNRKTGKSKVIKGYNNIMSMTYGLCVAGFEMSSNAFKEWCKKYPEVQQADRHTEELEKNTRKEFCSNFVKNNNKYNPQWTVEKIKTREKDLGLSA